MRKIQIGVMLGLMLISAAEAQEPVRVAPWWQKERIRFMWGGWPKTNSEVPREVFRNIALSGATVFADPWTYNPNEARLAKEFGIRYFACSRLHYLTWEAGGRTWVNQEGKEVEKYPGGTGNLHRCPLDKFVYERWLVDGARMDGIREGIIDGVLVDWESTEAGICYCDDCFSRFLESKKSKVELPEKTKRFEFLKEEGLFKAYEDNFHQRRVEMFTLIRQKAQAVNPDFLFASYGMLVSDFTRAMNTPRTPFIVLDERHYNNDDRQPWWESYSQRLRQEGYLYIPGGWVNALFGSQPSQVSAARWIYEASINEDGVWLWFEHELTNDILLAYSSADREIRAVQDKVGKYLFDGKRDPNFVAAVEWTGRPETEQAIITQTYHLGKEHLAHINNVDCDWPLRVRVRFPYLLKDKRWTVRDPMSEQYYTRNGNSAVWTTSDLLAGVVVAMEPRSDLFLLVSPEDEKIKVDQSRLMYSREFDVLPGHAAASAQASPVKSMAFSLPKDGWRFKMDEKNDGIKAKWFLPTASFDGWAPIEIECFWGGQGGTGPGWYRGDVNIPEAALSEGKQVYLHFGAVDEELMLWIDGQFAGEHNIGPEGWDKPFALDVSGKLTAGKHHLAMRVYNSAAAGGVWKPVSILAGPAIESAMNPTNTHSVAGTSGRLVYTATEQTPTEQMAYAGGCGVGAIIDNTIRTADGDGMNQLRVRQLHGYLWSPQYSPDGKRIAFIHNASGRGQIFVMNADGSDAVNISKNDFCDRTPVWSPDGNRIVFASDRTGNWDIFTMNSEGGNQQRLAGNEGLDRAPAWSPDGRRIAWESHLSGMPNIWVCDADGRNSHPLIVPGEDIRVQEFRESNPPEIVDIGLVFPDSAFYLMDPVWSPDGKRIACVGLGQSSGNMVAVLEADGTRLLQLTSGANNARNLCWSPDGTQLAGTWRTAPGETERSGIFAIKADGKDKRWLIDVVPQGPRLGGAFRAGLMTWYSHGSAQPRRVVKTFTSLAWSPDGQTLAFSSDNDPSGAFYVYTISPNGGEPRRLDQSKSAWPNQIMWRADKVD